MTQVIVLNGGSSSGKTGIARCLQAVLPRPWLRFSIDDLVEALPQSLVGSDVQGIGISFGEQGEVGVGEVFREFEAAWMTGMAAAQALLVHDGVVYDLEVDTSRTESLDCARAIAARVTPEREQCGRGHGK